MTAHHDPDRLTAAVLTSALLAGCTCSPDVDLTEEGDGIHRATVRHDDWCALLIARTAHLN